MSAAIKNRLAKLEAATNDTAEQPDSIWLDTGTHRVLMYQRNAAGKLVPPAKPAPGDMVMTVAEYCAARRAMFEEDDC